MLAVTSEVLSAVRRAKSDAKVSMRAEVDRVSVSGTEQTAGLLQQAEGDLKAAARAEDVVYSSGEFSVESVLAEA